LAVRRLADPKLKDFKYNNLLSGNSSVGRASASQAEGREFETRFPLFLKILEFTFQF
jgi:hypothetical protein